MGYSETSKAYTIYLPSQRRTVKRRDVRFEESRIFRMSHDPLPIEGDDKEREALKIDGRLVPPTVGTESSDQEEELKAPSYFVRRRPRWLEQTLRDA